jgi:predicted ArsR family transcriptional regulator
MTKKEIQEHLDELESAGVVCKTGRFRPDRAGVPQLVYQAVPEEEQDEAAKAYARLIGQGRLPYT